MKVGILGATGCIGQILSNEFSDSVRLSRNSNDRFYELSEKPKLEHFKGLDILIHCAWEPNNLNQNLNAIGSLFDVANAAGVKRVIFISSMAAFEGCRSEAGRTKLKMEREVLSRGGTVVRPGMVLGDSERGLFAKLKKVTKRLGVAPKILPKDEIFAISEDDLAGALRMIVEQGFDSKVLTVCYQNPMSLADLLSVELAKKRNFPIHGPTIKYILKLIESFGVKINPGSDSLISLLNQPSKMVVDQTRLDYPYQNPIVYLTHKRKLETKRSELEHSARLLVEHPSQWFWQGAANRRRAERRAEILFQNAKTNDISLELGSGSGEFSKRYLVNSIPQSFYISDLSSGLLQFALKEIIVSGAVVLDCEKLPFQNDSLDFIFGSSILHHLNLEQSLREIIRVLKPGGRFSFCEPNLLNPQIFLQKNIPVFKRMAGDLEHETAWSRFAAERAAERAGFSEVRTVPFDFLHPAISEEFIPYVEKFLFQLERIPVLREIAGSWHLSGRK